MKTLMISLGFIILFLPTMMVAQQEYLDLNFEKVDTTGKTIFQWKDVSDGAMLMIDTTLTFSGKNALYVRLKHPKDGASYYMQLPTFYYQGMRTIDIYVSVKMPNAMPNAGIWCSVKKDREYLGGASSYKANPSSPIFPNARFQGKDLPQMPYTWIPCHFEIKIDKDPTEVLIGISVSKDRAWFDDIKIKINGKPINDMVFKVIENE
ncbi:MAG: hypothetical protein WCO13_05870 [Bacteroidota bacterium]